MLSQSTVVWPACAFLQIATNPELVVVPHLDNMLSGIRFFHTEDNLINVFTWALSTVTYESPVKNEELLDAPVFRGDVIAIKKEFLATVGNFDEHFRHGIGHHLELSLRIWMCSAGTIQVE